MAQIHSAMGARALVSLAEGFGFGPVLEHGPVGPDGVRRIQRMVFVFGTAQQVEFLEARHAVEQRLAAFSRPFTT